MNDAKLHDWWSGYGYEGDLQRLPLVDVRSVESYNARRIVINSDSDVANNVVVHLPFETLLSGERSCELPPRHVSFAVLTDHHVDQQRLQDFFGATVSKATQQSRKAWLVLQFFRADETFWAEAEKHGIVEKGIVDCSSTSNNEFVPSPRLWQPDPLVERVLLPLLKASLITNTKNCESIDNTPEIWDLGSGAGRDACFLAEELKKCKARVKIVGIDNHKASAKRCLPFWKHRRVDDVTEAQYLDLNKVDLVKQHIENQSFICLYAVRFWNRKLVTFLANENETLQKGNIFAISHFCKPHEGASWNFDHPKEKKVLERNELKAIFEETGKWEVLHDDIAPDGDHGRTLVHFVARRTV